MRGIFPKSFIQLVDIDRSAAPDVRHGRGVCASATGGGRAAGT